MSDPKTEEERVQAIATRALARDGELLVSTACPGCEVRFALLVWREFRAKKPGTFSLAGAGMKTTGQLVNALRCVRCGWTGDGGTAEDVV